MVSVGGFGGVGTGKTALIVGLLGENIRRGIPAFGNIHIDYPSYTYKSTSELLAFDKQLDNSSIFGDEWYLVTESRRSSATVNLGASYARFQSRKRGQDFFCTAQLASTVDIREFLMMEIKYACYGLNEESGFFEYDCVVEGRCVPVAISLKWFEEFVFPFYDTFEIVKPLGFDSLIAEIERRSDVEKFNRRIDNLVDAFLYYNYDLRFDQIKKFDIDDFVTFFGYPELLASFAYDRVRAQYTRR